MYRIIPLLLTICTVKSATYQQYGASTIYPGGSSYGTSSSYPNQYGSSYGSTIGNYGSNAGSYGSNVGSYGSNAASYGSNIGSYGSNSGSYGSSLGTYGNNLGGYGSNGGSYGSYSEGSRYPNYSPGYSTTGYNSYNTYTTIRPGYGSNNYQNVYNTQKYGGVYGSTYGGRSYSPYELPFMKDMGSCVNRSPQTGIWLNSLMGMWYGVEFVEHYGGNPRMDRSRSCIVIHIAEPMDKPSTENQFYFTQHLNAKFRQEYRNLRLLWDEAGFTNEYSLFFRNDTAGYWQVFGAQNGTIPSRPSYQQFSGTVQVLKAVGNHLLLNFCQEAKNGQPAQLYSVLFSRDPGQLNRWDLDSIHGLLQNRKLSVASRRMVCGNNSAGKPVHSLLISVLLFALTCVLVAVGSVRPRIGLSGVLQERPMSSSGRTRADDDDDVF